MVMQVKKCAVYFGARRSGLFIKSRRDWVSIAAVQNHVVFKWRLSVRPSVRLSVRLTPYNSKSGYDVRLNLECQQSPRPGEGYRRKKIKKS